MRKLPLILLALTVTLLAPAAADAKPKPKYHLALGDSLAWGYQADVNGTPFRSAKGYVNQVHKAARKRQKKLKLVNYACPGENLATFVDGGCIGQGLVGGDATRSQWDKAAAFLKKHRKRTSFITISIGANEFTPCAAGESVDISCVLGGLENLNAELPKVAAKLRKAAGRKARIVIHDLYNPYLALALKGGSYATLAYGSVELVKTVNAAIRTAVEKARFRVAGVAGPFEIANLSETTTLAGQTVPVAVERVCALTQQCLPAPQGNIHPSDAGYTTIAKAFKKALRLR